MVVIHAVDCSQGNTALGLELLTSLAEEGDALERRRRAALLPILMRRSPDVLNLLGRALSGHLAAGGLQQAVSSWLIKVHCCMFRAV